MENVNTAGDPITGKVVVVRVGGIIEVDGVRVGDPLGIKTSKLPAPGKQVTEFKGEATMRLPVGDRWLVEHHPFGAEDNQLLPWFMPKLLTRKQREAIRTHRLYRAPLPAKLVNAVRAADARVAGENVR